MKYDLEYYERMLRINSMTAKEICDIRWKWIMDVYPRTVLDYGCGVGWFRAYRAKGVEVDTFDIGPYPQTGIKLKIYDVICFWDVLEHIPDFSVIEAPLALSKHVALSIPIIHGDLCSSRHFKIGEHLHYWTEDTLTAFFKKFGFEVVKKGEPECPPRRDVWSFLFKKIAR